MAESEASLDEQLELKKRARRRLVGATALALLAAIVLPVVMDHEPRPANQDIQVRIPSQDAVNGIAARVLPAKPAATPLPPVAEAPPPAAPSAEPKAEAKGEAKPEPKAEAKPAADAPKAAVAVPAPSAAAAKSAAKAADKPSDKKAEEARAVNALGGDAAAQWVVQLGAYKEAGNVKLLLAKLKGVGLPAYTEKFDSPQGPRTRVRAGPFASKDAAEKARTKVKIIGVDGPVAPK
ncbi:MAG: SPOR domain-containing protein [Rhodocyclaceae bacterium]|nr:SPOR domain-containing protein [Rhodocyclaceae bacterium]